MEENKKFTMTDFFSGALECSLEMTDPQKYSVLNKKELAFVHQVLEFFSEYDDDLMDEKIMLILKSSRDMYLHNLNKGKQLGEKEQQFLRIIDQFWSAVINAKEEGSNQEGDYMNKEGYAVTCSKCGSYEIKYEYEKTTVNAKTNETKTPVICLECGHKTYE